MASLALIASILFLLVIFYGIFLFFLSGVSFIPRFIIVILGIFGILLGFWWFCLPIGPIRIIGGLTICLSVLSIKNRF